jgi:hypothetical protein
MMGGLGAGLQEVKFKLVLSRETHMKRKAQATGLLVGGRRLLSLGG